MHETRNFLAVIGLIGCVIWAAIAWFVMGPLGPDAPWLVPQRIASLIGVGVLGGLLLYAFNVEDKMPNLLKQTVGDVYYECDGLSFLPIVRLNQGRPELRVYYQNRFENTVQAVIHLRPPEDPDTSFVIRPGVRDVHFAFRADGGDFGVIHQPIHVPESLRGQVVQVQLAAASYYPRSHGSRLLRTAGLPCGSILVDWQGAAFKAGVHEVSGEVDMQHPVTMHLSMPIYEDMGEPDFDAVWRQERLTSDNVMA